MRRRAAAMARNLRSVVLRSLMVGATAGAAIGLEAAPAIADPVAAHPSVVDAPLTDTPVVGAPVAVAPSRPLRHRPRRVQIYGSTPGPNSVRQCEAHYVQEFRPAGTVIVPRMHCWWQG